MSSPPCRRSRSTSFMRRPTRTWCRSSRTAPCCHARSAPSRTVVWVPPRRRSRWGCRCARSPLVAINTKWPDASRWPAPAPGFPPGSSARHVCSPRCARRCSAAPVPGVSRLATNAPAAPRPPQRRSTRCLGLPPHPPREADEILSRRHRVFTPVRGIHAPPQIAHGWQREERKTAVPVPVPEAPRHTQQVHRQKRIDQRARGQREGKGDPRHAVEYSGSG